MRYTKVLNNLNFDAKVGSNFGFQFITSIGVEIETHIKDLSVISVVLSTIGPDKDLIKSITS